MWVWEDAGGERQGLMPFFSDVVKNRLEDFAIGDGVLVIYVVANGGLFKYVELFNIIEVGAFVVGV